MLGYSQTDPNVSTHRSPLYGFYKAEWLGLPESASRAELNAACSTKPKDSKKWLPEMHRFCKGGNWVADGMFEKYGN